VVQFKPGTHSNTQGHNAATLLKAVAPLGARAHGRQRRQVGSIQPCRPTCTISPLLPSMSAATLDSTPSGRSSGRAPCSWHGTRGLVQNSCTLNAHLEQCAPGSRATDLQLDAQPREVIGAAVASHLWRQAGRSMPAFVRFQQGDSTARSKLADGAMQRVARSCCMSAEYINTRAAEWPPPGQAPAGWPGPAGCPPAADPSPG
jgi:hypothetical protein